MTSCSDKKMPEELIPLLEEKYAKYWWKEEDELDYKEAMKDPFKNIIFTLLSQNTSSQNTRRAYAGLKSNFEITPQCLFNADEEEISKAIKPGGLHRIKAGRIKKISEYVLKNYNGNLSWVFEMPKDKVREELIKIPGIGDKTADVLLSSIHGQREAFVIDTHMQRIAKRLGLVDKKASYKEIQKKLNNFFPWKKISKEKEERIVGLFWLLAKHTCKAIKPRCNECILNEVCEKVI